MTVSQKDLETLERKDADAAILALDLARKAEKESIRDIVIGSLGVLVPIITFIIAFSLPANLAGLALGLAIGASVVLALGTLFLAWRGFKEFFSETGTVANTIYAIIKQQEESSFLYSMDNSMGSTIVLSLQGYSHSQSGSCPPLPTMMLDKNGNVREKPKSAIQPIQTKEGLGIKSNDIQVTKWDTPDSINGQAVHENDRNKTDDDDDLQSSTTTPSSDTHK